MQITHDRKVARGVTQLMYVGDDGTPVASGKAKAVKIGVAVGIAALVYWLATKKT